MMHGGYFYADGGASVEDGICGAHQVWLFIGQITVLTVICIFIDVRSSV